MFQGASSLNLDAKGRLSVPTRHRDALGAVAGGGVQLTITKHPDGCLMVFPPAAWEVFRKEIAAMPMDSIGWRRFFLGNAMEVDMDASGRVLIAPELRNFARITKEAVLLGMGSYLELWDTQVYAAKEAETMKAPMPDVLKAFSF
ncbi:MAG: division/cell wall cluster transcriptional repressor MraZ [Hydrogenophaga sp.]|nr:division/cell wall cluster transcriptional repressor MraZ [Hydrogenophaga sp.]